MSWKEIEFMFNRALSFSFSRKKLFFIFPALAVCGLLILFFRTLAIWAGDWVSLSLIFLPLFLCSGVLLGLGTFLVRVYHNEVKGFSLSYRKMLRQSWDLMLGISYLSFPFVLAYLLLWTLLGLFYLLKEIPTIGDLMGVILSFGPFLLVLGSLLLSLASLFLLFFLTPAVALKSVLDIKLAEQVFKRLRTSIFSNGILFLLGLLPLLAVVGLLSLAVLVTGLSYLEIKDSLSLVLTWFFIMIPFCALLSPAIVFFFNFAAESYLCMQGKRKSSL